VTNKLRIAACLVLATMLALMLSASALADGQVPSPDNDPFYAVPNGIAGLANGTIIKSRAVSVSSIGVPLPARAWQLQYKSLDVQGRPTAMVTTVMIPTAAWTGSGPRPLVSYQVAEDGADQKCAASYALDGGLAAGETESNAYAETGLIALALARGWAVVASDYEGPTSAFLAAPEEAHGVLDGIRAALAFGPAGFSAKTQVATWGYSGGGYATSVAALYQPSYAPGLHIVGAAVGSPAASVEAEVNAFNGSVAGGAIPMSIAAIERAYPGENIGQYLNAAGRAAVTATAHDCLEEAAEQYPLGNLDEWEAKPNALEQPALVNFLNSISPEFMPGHPAIPIFLYTDKTDEFAPASASLAMAANWCARGSTVDVHLDPVGEHIAYEEIGAPFAMAYLSDRFSGAAAPRTCMPPSTAPSGSRAALRALLLLPGAIGLDRDRLVLRVRNPNSVAVTIGAAAVRIGARRAIAFRGLRVAVSAGRTRTVRLLLGRRSGRRLRAARRIALTLTARAVSGDLLTSRATRSLRR
jgi:pimeloyl-ACP methyl ester carboxylesterase